MKAQLDEQSGDWASQHYLFSNGDYISHTLGAHAERIKAGKRSPQRQDTCAYIYHCHVGFGKTEIETPDGENQTVRWKKNDTFALPAWSRLVHEADVRSDAYLFVINDRPLQERLGMFFVNEPKN